MSEDVHERPGDAPGLLHVVVLGGYGLIGSAIVARLMARGHHVSALGRSENSTHRPRASAWHFADIGTQTVDEWRHLLKHADVVVNASGALQDGARDNLKAIHETALTRLAEAVQGTRTRIVQISAAGVSQQATTDFLRSKARGEAALQETGLDAIILRPTLVIAQTAYGGTALLRAAAALPWVLPRVFPKAMIQCVHIDDLSEAVLDAVEGRISGAATVDVTGPTSVALPDLLHRMRLWLGFAETRFQVPVPVPVLAMISFGADIAGKLGWRAPLRSTALTVLRNGIAGDSEALPRAGGSRCRSVDEIFATLPSTTQDRWFARAFLLMPLAVVTLSLFWFVSGLVGLWQISSATDVLSARGIPVYAAMIMVVGGSLFDIALGAAILVRDWAKRACVGMILLSLAYLVGGTLFAPDLWADPLGPLVKVIPTIMLTLFTLAFLDDR